MNEIYSYKYDEHTICPLTGLYYNRTFMAKLEEFVNNIQPNDYCVVAIDIEHFRLFKKLYGKDAGNELIAHIAKCIHKLLEMHPGIGGYFGGDNFSLIMPYDMTLVKALRDDMIAGVQRWNNTIGFLPFIGVYRLDDLSAPSEVIYDRATQALTNVLGKHSSRICEFDYSMETSLEEEINLLAEIQTALTEGEFTFFAQPQCDISTGKIIGAEALARWIHPTKGLISPGIFIPVLEKNGIISDLDRYVWKKVCEWLHSWIERGHNPIPVSINVSRVDIFSMDVPAYLLELIQTYNLPQKLLKIEITESAYADSNDKINSAVQVLRDNGFIVMMDDFGCGYSSLNMLKNVPVDVLKLDMRFLDIGENDEEKGIGILESVVNMARLMRLPIIVEGVETEKQEKFLQNMGCRYTQGFYYYKPLPLDQFEALLTDERRLDFNGLWCKQVEALHLREFLDNNFFSDTMLNNVLGPIAFYEMFDNQIEITRVNEQYFRLAGASSGSECNYDTRLGNHVRDDDRPLLFTIFQQAYENPITGAEGYLHFLRTDGTVLWIYLKVFFLRERDGRKLFYSSLTDMTSQKQNRTETNPATTTASVFTHKPYEEMVRYYNNMPFGYSVIQLLLDSEGKAADFQIIYANQELNRLCDSNWKQLKNLFLALFEDEKKEIFELAYRAAYLGETVTHDIYSSISSRYLQLTFYQYEPGYLACTTSDITHTQIYEKALNSIMYSYREVYFLHLKHNYIRMIYPDDNNLLERGNYEESVNRHFRAGKITQKDEENVRKFLSLSNLQEVLKDQSSTEYAYRRCSGGMAEEWCLNTITVSERDRNGNPEIAIMVIRSIEALMQETVSKRKQHMAESFAGMSEGFFIYHATGKQKLLYANPKVLQIYGCETIEEFREMINYSFCGMVHPDDWSRIEWEINDQITHSQQHMAYNQYRIIRKDGSVRWIDDVAHLENATIGSGGGLFYVFISDVTDTITERRKMELINRNQYFKKQDE